MAKMLAPFFVPQPASVVTSTAASSSSSTGSGHGGSASSPAASAVQSASQAASTQSGAPASPSKSRTLLDEPQLRALLSGPPKSYVDTHQAMRKTHTVTRLPTLHVQWQDNSGLQLCLQLCSSR